MKKLFSKRYKRYYQESKMHLFIDLAFVIIIIILIASNIILFKKQFPIKSIQINVNQPQLNGKTEKSAEIRNTNLILNSNILYYTTEGEQLGVGPWPPIINETSSVRIIIDISSTTHNVKELQFLAKLPSNITWTNKTAVNTGSAMIYDKANNLIVWQIGSWPANQKAQASFEIEFMPSQDDLGKKIKLLENLNLLGVDSMTGQSISAAGTNLHSPEVE